MESPLTHSSAVDAAAARLLDAELRKAACAPVRDLIGSGDEESAYAVQQIVAAARKKAGATRVGRKIGLTSDAVQQQLGVSQPDFGALYDDMAYVGGDTVPADSVLQPRVEAEIAFILGQDLAEGPLDVAQVRAAVDYAVVAIEICDSRIQDWDITFGDTVADNASAGAFVLGPTRKPLAEFEPKDTVMSMTIDGVEVSSGNGAACMGDPLEAVAWLARKASAFGDPLRAGDVVLSGALGPMKSIVAGNVVRATATGLGAVTFTLS